MTTRKKPDIRINLSSGVLDALKRRADRARRSVKDETELLLEEILASEVIEVRAVALSGSAPKPPGPPEVYINKRGETITDPDMIHHYKEKDALLEKGAPIISTSAKQSLLKK